MGRKIKTRIKKLVRNMNKKIISILAISWLLVISIVSVNAANYEQQTAISITIRVYADIYIDDDAEPGGDGSYQHPFQTIKDGLNESEDGDIVYVFNGIYYGYFNIENEITLRGQSKENTKLNINIIDNFPTINVMSSNVTIKGFSILSPLPKNKHTRGIDIVCWGILDSGPYNNIHISDCNIYNQEYPSIVCNDAGEAVLVWQDKRRGNYDIYAEKISANGKSTKDFYLKPFDTVIMNPPFSGRTENWLDISFQSYIG